MESWIAQSMSFQFSTFYLSKEAVTRMKMEADFNFSLAAKCSHQIKCTQIFGKRNFNVKASFNWIAKVNVNQ